LVINSRDNAIYSFLFVASFGLMLIVIYTINLDIWEWRFKKYQVEFTCVLYVELDVDSIASQDELVGIGKLGQIT